MLKVCFITDGGMHLGLGHVQQSITFARALLPNADICFLTKSDALIVARIAEAGFTVTGLENDSSILRKLQELRPDVVIFDKLDVDETLASDIKQNLSTRLVIFTNLSGANKFADIAVTADIGSAFENLRYIDKDTGTLNFYGPRYWVLRPEFDAYHQKGKVRAAATEQVLLIFGGSDPANLTSVALDQLLSLDRHLEIDAVLGSHFSHEADVLEMLQRHEKKCARVKLYRNIKNVAELMYRADLVIASPGLSAFEALRVGTPIVVVPHDSLQRDTYQGHMRMIERNELWKLGSMIEAGDFTYPNDQPISRMEIGQGVHELKEVIMAKPTGHVL